MAPEHLRFRLRTFLLAIAVFAVLLGLCVWYFTPRLQIRLIPGKSSGTYDELGEAVVEITNRAPRPIRLPHQAGLLGLDLVVTDARGNVVTPYPYWHRISPVWPEPRDHTLRWGESHREAVHLFGSATGGLPPGTYTVEATYTNGAVGARSEKVTVRVLPGETYRSESRYDPVTGRNTWERVKNAPDRTP